MKKILTIACMIACTFCVPDCADADYMLLGTIGAGSANSQLVEINPATGALVRTIGSVGYTVNGLAYDVTTGILYGSTAIQDPTYNGLIEINLSTGVGTPVSGTSGWGLPSLISRSAVTNITVSSTGAMFGWWEAAQDDLVSINKATGIATRVGESGISTGTYGLSFDAADVLHLVNYDGNVYTINTASGVATFVGDLHAVAHHGDFDPASGLWYGIDVSGNTNPRSLVLANLSNFTYTTLPTLDNLHTLTFVQTSSSVPEPTTILLCGLGLLGLAGLRREPTA